MLVMVTTGRRGIRLESSNRRKRRFRSMSWRIMLRARKGGPCCAFDQGMLPRCSISYRQDIYTEFIIEYKIRPQTVLLGKNLRRSTYPAGIAFILSHYKHCC